MRRIVVALAFVIATAIPVAAQSAVDPYTVFANARQVWLMQKYPTALRYTVALHALDNGSDITKHYLVRYDLRTNEATPDTISQEQRDRPYRPVGCYNFSLGPIGLSKPEPLPDPFGLPALAPNYSFGIAPAPQYKKLSDKELVAQIRAEFPNPRATPTPNTLVEIGSVTAVHRDYEMQLVGVEPYAAGTDYHIALHPLRDPKRYRLRELWIDTKNYTTQRLVSEGNFARGPVTKVRWMVSFVQLHGVQYIATERAQDTVRFSNWLHLEPSHLWTDYSVSFEGLEPDTGRSILP
ncbi:MAG: hypothetical protein M3N19_02265, partial [Candidatus Eremiobacteraeota bacterium]|nr:hypothetical protein [Candidatus Eremiobacteraeota bacterium]